MADARIFADLEADHYRHRALLARLAEAECADRAGLFESFRVEVSAHAAAEEESLYAAMLARPETRDDARHSVAEHKEIDDLLGALAALDPAAPEWTAKFAEMRHRYQHHIDEEEDEMFPAAAKDLPPAEKERIAAVFEARKPRELAIAEECESGDARD